jgi:hypothetical protein
MSAYLAHIKKNPNMPSIIFFLNDKQQQTTPDFFLIEIVVCCLLEKMKHCLFFNFYWLLEVSLVIKKSRLKLLDPYLLFGFLFHPIAWEKNLVNL